MYLVEDRVADVAGVNNVNADWSGPYDFIKGEELRKKRLCSRRA